MKPRPIYRRRINWKHETISVITGKRKCQLKKRLNRKLDGRRPGREVVVSCPYKSRNKKLLRLHLQ